MYKSAAYQQGYNDAYAKYAGIGDIIKRIGGDIRKLITKKPPQLTSKEIEEFIKRPDISTLDALGEVFKRKKMIL